MSRLVRETQPTWRRFGGDVGRYGGDVGEMWARCGRDIGEIWHREEHAQPVGLQQGRARNEGRHVRDRVPGGIGVGVLGVGCEG